MLWAHPDAVNFCMKKREENAITAAFFAASGISYMEVYAPNETFEKIENLAESLCKSHRDWRKEPFSQILN